MRVTALLAACMFACVAHGEPTAAPTSRTECSAAPSEPVHVIRYAVRPSKTDGDKVCKESDRGAMGCGKTAPNDPHVFALSSSYKTKGTLLVFLPGGNTEPGWSEEHDACTGNLCGFYDVAAKRGYHVIALSYFTRGDERLPNVGGTCKKNLACYGKFMNEVLNGSPDCGDACGQLSIDEHPDDSIVGRLRHALQWAHESHPGHGWGQYLSRSGNVDWSRVAVAGTSLGSGYAAMLGLQHPDEIRRVVLLASPNDGRGDGPADWEVAPWIQPAGAAAAKFYGLVHYKNKLENEDDPSVLYKTLMAWERLGMKGLLLFDPKPGATTDFLGSHMLVSVDSRTTAAEAHTSVNRDWYDSDACKKKPPPSNCKIGYEDAWHYILGRGAR